MRLPRFDTRPCNPLADGNTLAYAGAYQVSKQFNSWYFLNDSNGFTLMEIMVAVSIFAILMTTLFSGFRGFFLSSQKIRQEVEQMERVQYMVRRIRMDLKQIYIVPRERYAKPDSLAASSDPFGFRAIKEYQGGKEFSCLVFTSLAHAWLGSQARPGPARISYYVKANDQEGYDLFRSDVLYPFPSQERFCHDPVLGCQLSRFQVVFIDTKGNEHETWDSDAKDFGYSFPGMICFTLGLGTGENERLYKCCVSLAAQRDPID